MTFFEWIEKYNRSPYIRAIKRRWVVDIDLKLLWDTCLDHKVLLAILESDSLDTIYIKSGTNTEDVLKDPLRFRPEIVGLEYTLLRGNMIDKDKGIRMLKHICDTVYPHRACELIRTKTDYPFVECERHLVLGD